MDTCQCPMAPQPVQESRPHAATSVCAICSSEYNLRMMSARLLPIANPAIRQGTQIITDGIHSKRTGNLQLGTDQREEQQGYDVRPDVQ